MPNNFVSNQLSSPDIVFISAKWMYTSLSFLPDMEKIETREKAGKWLQILLDKKHHPIPKNYHYTENPTVKCCLAPSEVCEGWQNQLVCNEISNCRSVPSHQVYNRLTLMKFKILFWMFSGKVYLGCSSLTRLSLTNSFFTIRDWKLGPQFCMHMSIS